MKTRARDIAPWCILLSLRRLCEKKAKNLESMEEYVHQNFSDVFLSLLVFLTSEKYSRRNNVQFQDLDYILGGGE